MEQLSLMNVIELPEVPKRILNAGQEIVINR
jgi:hypothetical protein